jgi:hypothetical protein
MIRNEPNINDIDFLKVFCIDAERLYFKTFHDALGSNAQKLDCNLDEYEDFKTELIKINNEGNGIFFVVNRGGQKNEEINRITSHFLDFDFGKVDTGRKDAKGKIVFEYRSNEVIEILKEDFLIKIDMFKLEPSIVNETKNGFHVYWIVKDGQVNVFTKIEEELIKYFKNNICTSVDYKVKDLTRVLRVPEFMHQKNPKEPFKIKCIKFDTDLIYTQQDICDAINVNYSELIEMKQEKNRNPKKPKTEHKTTKSIIEPVKYRDSSVKRIKKTYTPISVHNYTDLFNYLKQQDLIEFLDINTEINQNFCCILHNDTRPSARITLKDGYYKYFCNSSNCDFSHDEGLDIIDIIMKREKYSIVEALNYLCDKYNVQLVETEWIKKQKEKYIMNFSFINNYKDIKKKYSNLYRLIWRYFTIITQINSIALSNIYKDEFNFESENIFYMSNRYLAGLLKKDVGKINKYINLLCTLKLLNKIELDSVPTELKTRAKAEQKEKYNAICFYTINNYYDISNVAEKVATKLVKANFSITAMSYEYIKSILGDVFADKVYSVKMKSTKRTKSLEEILEDNIISNLSENGYFNIDMLKNKRVYVNNKYIDFNTKKRIFKRVLPDLIDKYCLTYKKANKTDMKEHNLKGSIYILVRN